MVPLEVLFSRLQLPLRDAAEREDRDVRLETSGADVHLDKTIVDSLFQPMLHLVRNAVSHGIEAAAARARRRQAGARHGHACARARSSARSSSRSPTTAPGSTSSGCASAVRRSA